MFDKLKAIPMYMDYDGQRKAEKLFQTVVLLFAAIGFGWGYVVQRYSVTIYVLLVGFLTSCILTLPPWPVYRKHPLKWQKPVADESGDNTGLSSGGSSTSSSSSSKKHAQKRK